ncbi:tRNA (adenine(58)-N(1))-methyltransferase non-catalytic subunit trm6 [Recurvomyces mirabilis]|uniref:tRNA (adenine(58)-N(1))-methyltransferase non-catalytic subunit TRM6 n=1 Tax=Recurvomyces mirabilis TaxID=574656 RepID=A0AAE1C015_9PEZI|nr:tRNA (adenine(58)-N(1))-methyltransferase non-catalytic subunit trm6 [Recurvomyces mirabilis]KAK5151093.1 tRNA (adenine(58)-N(1))-methyltransferase non-catalytic subunit trm6 [Recurvomyces mirabilis]
MSTSRIQPNTWLFLRLPSRSLKCLEIKPNTIIDVGKLGQFPSNLLLGRPYYHTYEILEKAADEAYSRLRIVTPDELNAEVAADEATPAESRAEPATPGVSDGASLPKAMEEAVVQELKNNRLTIDDASRQALSQEDIEQLKKSSAGKEIIDKILANHAGLDEKTVFSRAKYVLRKRSKYLKRFTVLPMDVGTLILYLHEKEPARILEMREETLGLIMAWSNMHGSHVESSADETSLGKLGTGRWLTVDETGGLLVAAMAERMDILHKYTDEEQFDHPPTNAESVQTEDVEMEDVSATLDGKSSTPASRHIPTPRDFPLPATSNTITLLHPAVQPNVSILKHFGYDSNSPNTDHPLHTHLKCLSWLQLLHPADDPTYRQPDTVPDPELFKWKSGKRGNYHKKQRRWQRCQAVVHDTQRGNFDGLIIASNMDPATILPHTIPLVRGGGHIVIYSPTIEPLVKIMDLYSKDRRAAYIQHLSKGETPSIDDFPLDPRLLLAPTLQTSRVREWQVLPGRTHPRMTSRGGSEGFVFTARRVLPVEGGVEARGNFTGKKRKGATNDAATPGGDIVDAGVGVGGA